MWICDHPYCQPKLHHNKHIFVCFHKQYHNPQMLGTLVLVNISFGMHLAHIVYVNFLVMIDVIFETHMDLHVPIKTLALVYVYFKMCLALTMAYINLASSVLWDLVKMCLAFHVPFKTLIMAYVFIKMHLAFHVPFKILAMGTFSLECVWPHMFPLEPWLWFTFLLKRA